MNKRTENYYSKTLERDSFCNNTTHPQKKEDRGKMSGNEIN
jgi:hypothetical protein